jgi:hypothetical protein
VSARSASSESWASAESCASWQMRSAWGVISAPFPLRSGRLMGGCPTPSIAEPL